MDRETYNNYIEKLIQCVKKFQKEKITNNKTIIYLANGDILNIRIPQNGIAHLLGINTDYLKLENIVPFKSNSFEILQYLLDNEYRISNLILKERKLNSDKLFSKHIKEKLDSFWENINIRLDNIIAIIKYDSEKTYKLEKVSEISDYYIIKKKDNIYYILGLKKTNEVSNNYIPTTSRKYESFDELDQFLNRIVRNQELTFPTAIHFLNSEKDIKSKKALPEKTKIEKLENITYIADRYHATTSVGNELLFQLKKITKILERKQKNTNIILELSEAIKVKQIMNIIITQDTYEEILQLIDNYNHLLKTTNPLQNEEVIKVKQINTPKESHQKVKKLKLTNP